MITEDSVQVVDLVIVSSPPHSHSCSLLPLLPSPFDLLPSFSLQRKNGIREEEREQERKNGGSDEDEEC